MGNQVEEFRDQVLKIIAEHRDVLHSRYNVASLSLFGSVARDESRSDSDVDILVTFSETPGIFTFIKLKEYLQKILSRPVDLVTKNALKKQLREKILKESIRAT